MHHRPSNTGKFRQWTRWFLFSEAALLVLAIFPGRRSVSHDPDRALIARLLIEDPGFIETVAVNLVALNLFVIAVFIAAWFVGRRKR